MENRSDLNNELKSFDEIMQEKRFFRIPDYQRGYSWEEQQRTDLLKDIEYLIKGGNNYRHYTGTIVASLSGKKNGYEVFDVVDGQQRMTSLILLLSVICRLLKGPKVESRNKCEEISSKFIQDVREGKTIRKLHLGKQDELFRRLVTEGNTPAIEAANSKSDQNLKDAVNEYDEWLKRKDINVNEVLKCIRNKLGFLLYAPKNDREIGIMFEVINNRGKALTELEKIKNYLIYYAVKNDKGDISERVNASWPSILSNLNKIGYTSNESEDRFLRNCWIVFMDTHKSRSYYVYDNLKQMWPPEGDDTDTSRILDFIDFLRDAAFFYAQYLKREGVTDKQEKKWLERISCHPADASITPLILAIFSKVTDEKQRTDLFKLLEKLNFRFYGTGIAGRADSGQGDLFWYANYFFNHYEQRVEGEIIDAQWLNKELTNFVDKRANDKSFIQYLTLDKDESGDYYDWRGLKFFLASYEDDLRKDNNEGSKLREFMELRDPQAHNDFYHKEHIWAKKHATKFDDTHNLNVNKRRLGNFLLLKETINIKVSNKPPEEKVEQYFSDWKNAPNTLMIRELKSFFDKAKKEEDNMGWHRKTFNYWYNVYQRFMDKREEKMINFALKRWRVSGLGSKISEVSLDSLNSDNEIYRAE